MSNKVNYFFSKPDLYINFEKFGKESNLLFITGLVGAGKSTVGKQIAKKYNAVYICQDWFAWKDKYTEELCNELHKELQKRYPETKEYVVKNAFRRKDILSKEQRRFYLREFENIIKENTVKHPNQLFVYEGSDIFLKTDRNWMKGNPILIKRTSALKSLRQVYIRNYAHKQKYSKRECIKLLVDTHIEFHLKHRKKLNQFIKIII